MILVDIKQDIERTKKRSKWGCMIWAVILIFGPIISFLGYFYYQLEIKERTLIVSHSPNAENTIEIVQKGEAAFFGPSSVRIKYGNKHIDRIISNDGKTLYDSNIFVEWKSDDSALITLLGEEQYPETIEFNKEKRNPFKNVQVELESQTLTTSVSPDQTKAIEIIETIMSQGENPERFLRIYYGDNGSMLKEFKEHNQITFYTDHSIEWVNNTQATVRIFRNDKIIDTIEIDFE